MSDSIGKGFNLVMELEDPNRLPELMKKLGSDEVRPRLQKALGSLEYVHYSRFLPLWGRGLLLIVTEFDGSMKDYVMDFAAALDAEFTLILSYMKGRPRLPVSRYPDEFWAYVDLNTGPKTIDPDKPNPLAYPDPFCAYPGLTALEIAGAARVKSLPPQPPSPPEPPVDLDDVQAHVLHSYRAARACHLGLEFKDAAKGRALLSQLLPLVSRASAPRDDEVCITLGVTHAGLQALGVPQPTLEQFPLAFREGPRLRHERLGDVGRSDPSHWTVAGYESPKPNERDGERHPVVVHGMVSVYCSAGADALKAHVRRVHELIDDAAFTRFTQGAGAIGAHGEIHFGYRDGIGQPQFAAGARDGAPPASREPAAAAPAPARATAPTGDLLLGTQYRNSRGGYYIGELPEELATHGTYAALRVIEQHAEAFEQWLDEVKARHHVERETTAAKLVGRWRNGSPLVLNPDRPDPQAAEKKSTQLDEFDYAAPPAAFDDRDGRRCPFGAHVRRVNPRGGMVLGVPWGRRVVRRGMPYGPKLDADRTKWVSAERGLVGLFLCGDLESQFEFVQHVWANEDLSAPGLRHTQDPFSSARDGSTPFRFRAREAEPELTVMVPPLTRTRGSAYLFMPGIGGLRWLAGAGWHTDSRD